MTCKDFLHYEVCSFWWNDEEKSLGRAERPACNYFAARSEYVHLPCKVGDKAYYLCRKPETLEWHIQATEVYKIMLCDDGMHIYVRPVFCGFLESEIGKRLFLTREEAEKALEERK